MTADAHTKANELKAEADQVRKDMDEYRRAIRRANAASLSTEIRTGEFGQLLLKLVNEKEGVLLQELRNQYKAL